MPVDDIFSQFGMNAEPTFGSKGSLAGLADAGDGGGEKTTWDDDDDLLGLSD